MALLFSLGSNVFMHTSVTARDYSMFIKCGINSKLFVSVISLNVLNNVFCIRNVTEIIRFC